MSVDSLLMFAAVLVAIYAIVPRARRLDLALRWHVIDWFIVGGWAVVVHYLVLHRVFSAQGWTVDWSWPVTAGEAAYIVTIVAFGTLTLRLLVFARLSPSKLPKLKQLVDELLGDERYAELADMLAKNMPGLTDFARRKPRRHRAEDDREQTTASDVLRVALHSPGFIHAMALSRPYFPLSIPDIKELGLSEFFDAYLRTLWSEPSSVLYTEIRNNQNSRMLGLYDISQENRLLQFLFGDAHVAEELQVWRPIGGALLSELFEVRRRPGGDDYNTAMGDFMELGRWEDRVFVGIRFFQLMVSAALQQNVRWHMWLHYLPYVVKEIVANYDPDPLHSEPGAEYPTRYSYLLYEIVSDLRDWIAVVPDLPAGQENTVLRAEDNTAETDSIPKSSVIALCCALRPVLLEGTIPFAFRQYLMDMVFDLYFDLRDDARTVRYAHALSCTLSRGGYGSKRDRSYISAVLSHFEQYPNRIKHEEGDITAFLGELGAESEECK